MDQPGPRHPPLKSPLIERADLQSSKQRTVFGALTLAFWAFWLYLWLPLLALLAWALGLEQAYKYMVVLGGYKDVIRVLAVYAVIILLLGGALVAWALYNILRFRGVENRVASKAVSSAEIARTYGIDAESVERWQGARHILVSHDPDGRISRVDTPAA